MQEHKQHQSEVLQVLYSTDGARLFTAGADGGLCVYDVAQVGCFCEPPMLEVLRMHGMLALALKCHKKTALALPFSRQSLPVHVAV